MDNHEYPPPPHLPDVLRFMLSELESNRLEVCKVPSRRESSDGRIEPGYIRVCVSVNAEWYQRFCRDYMGSRRRYSKLRTIIRRPTTRAALLRMIERGDRTTEYAKRLLRAAERLSESYGTPVEGSARSGRNRGCYEAAPALA